MAHGILPCQAVKPSNLALSLHSISPHCLCSATRIRSLHSLCASFRCHAVLCPCSSMLYFASLCNSIATLVASKHSRCSSELVFAILCNSVAKQIDSMHSHCLTTPFFAFPLLCQAIPRSSIAMQCLAYLCLSGASRIYAGQHHSCAFLYCATPLLRCSTRSYA